MEQSKGERNDATLDRYGLTKRQRYNQLWSQLDNDRQTFFPHWRELNDYIMPRRGRFLITDRNRGDRRTKSIVDSTATMSARTLSSGMMSGITSPARPWFRLTTPDPDLAEFAAVKDWLHTVSQRMRTVFVRSNWYNVLPTLYYDLGIFGTAAMMIEEDPRDVIRCTSFPIGSFLLGNDARGEVRIFMREFGMTVRQLVEKFVEKDDHGSPEKWDNISQRVKQAWKNNKREQWIDVVHAVTVNETADITKLDAKFKPFTDCYYEKANDNNAEFLRESGFDEFPVLAPRWSVTGEDTYGTDCPGMTSLGDIKQLQLGEKRGMQALEKLISPPMIAPPDMRAFKLSLLPGDVSYVDETVNKQFRPAMTIKPEIQQLEYKQEQVRQRIRRGFYEDLFLMLAYTDPSKGKQPVTAAEIAERHDEKLLALGPVLEQVEQDLLNPAIDRVFAIMVRAGDIPAPPRELEGVPLKVEFISIMAAAQKMVGLSGLERFTGFVGSIAAAQAVDPNSQVWDKVDLDQAIDEHADMMGIAPRVVVPDDKVQEIRAERAKQAQIEKTAALAQQGSQTAKNLSQSKVSPDNALGQVVGSIAPAA